LPRISTSLLAALILLATSILPTDPFPSTAAFNETAVTGAVEAGLSTEADGTVVAASLAASNLELALFDVTNSERAQAGLAPLGFNDELIGIARERARTQLSEPALTHFDFSGELAFTRLLRDAGIVYNIAGENLARVSGPTPDAAQRADQYLMQSHTHRANILDPRYTAMVVGSATDGSGTVVFVQIFHTDY
jgi:uncharacterized protein YkwD